MLFRPELYISIRDCIKGMRRNFRKLHKAQQSSRTLQSEVSLRHLPEGANVVEQMGKLQQPVMERMEWARRFRSPFPPHIDKDTFNEFMRLLFSSLYLFSPQGRISGNFINQIASSFCFSSHYDSMLLLLFRYWWSKIFQCRWAYWTRTCDVHQIQDCFNIRIPAGDNV